MASVRTELANRIREHRASLAQTLAEIAERERPLTHTEARLILETTDLRLGEVERSLRHAHVGYLRRLAPRATIRFAHRLKGLFKPRIGRLTHYPPRAIRVPASYHRARPLQPAPTISIVTPSFQHGRFIERTIQSVIGQGYPALEYVVQDGGSTDDTLVVLERHREYIDRCVSEPDNGHANALNRGFAATSGEIMGWLNSDDLLLPGSIAYVTGYFATHPQVDVVYGNRLMIDDYDREVGAWILPPHDDHAMTLADYVPQETLFWRRRVWDTMGGYVDESFGYALDWELLLRFRECSARIVHLPRFLGAFRVHPAQRTSLDYAAGLEEMARLRERVHGRPVSIEEVNAGLRPYLRRHVRAHLRQRVIDRLPIARVTVDFPLATNGPFSRVDPQRLTDEAPARLGSR